MVRIQNGGYTTDAFQAHPAPKPTSWARDHVPFDSMFGIGADDEGILQTPQLLREWAMPDGLVSNGRARIQPLKLNAADDHSDAN